MSSYISHREVRNIIEQQLGDKLGEHYQLRYPDRQYYCPSIKQAQKIIKRSSVDRKKWIKEKFDCDDFALVLKADFAKVAYKNAEIDSPYCFGIVWGDLPHPHALNWMINDDWKLRFVEPQSDEVYFPRSDHKNISFILV